MKFIYSLQSEWIKTKRSAASWLCLIGGFFIPTIQFFITMHTGETINTLGPGGWQDYFMTNWEIMGAFLLPMGVVLASSLITQMEYKNNTWKQLHTTPQSYTQMFFSKFSVIILMTLKFFLFFNIGIIISGLLPCLLLDAKLPTNSIPYSIFLKQNGLIFITVLPIIAIQYFISLQFKNFLVPIGIGILLLIGTMIGIQWKHIYISPYSLSTLKVLPFPLQFNLYTAAFIHFVLIMSVSFYFYINKREKG